jgi:hypothetical protein
LIYGREERPMTWVEDAERLERRVFEAPEEERNTIILLELTKRLMQTNASLDDIGEAVSRIAENLSNAD